MPIQVPDFYIKQGDTDRDLVYDLQEADGSGFDATGYTITFTLRKWGAAVPVLDAASADLVTANPARVRYQWQVGNTDVPGSYYGEFIAIAGSTVRKFPNAGHLRIDIHPNLS